MIPVELPPKPDPNCGEPRPPAAPLAPGKRGPRPRWRRKMVPHPPANESPPLEWWYYNARGLLWGAAAVLALAIGVLTLRDWSKGRDVLTWANSWLDWLLIGGLALLMTLGARGEKFSAAADWFMHGEDLNKTYELNAVDGVRRWKGTHLVLTDQHGHHKEIDLRGLQLNPALWDQVYNGILHSVANGAR